MRVSSSKDFSGGVRVVLKNNLCGVKKDGCFFHKCPIFALSPRPDRESTMMLWLPAGD